MKLIFLKPLSFTLICTLFLSCNSEPSLQTYYVDHQETSGFITMDFPISFLDIDKNNITESEQKAINSIQKFNMLGYNLKSGSDIVYKAELNFVNNCSRKSSTMNCFDLETLRMVELKFTPLVKIITWMKLSFYSILTKLDLPSFVF